jgi:DNA-binding MarR family transcriptional regulator
MSDAKVEAKSDSRSESSPFEGLDRVIHEKARLAILTALLKTREGLVFNDLKQLCDLTDGNLSRHLTTLQDATLVEIWKGTKGNRPQTLVRLTAAGRARFLDYLTVLEGIVAQALSTADAKDAIPRPHLGLAPG